MVPSAVCSEHALISWVASWVAARVATASELVAVHRLVHEDHVDVGDVVELVPAALAHRDHGQADGGGVLPHLRPGDREAGVERAGREVGQLGGHVVDADVVGEVAGRQPDQHPAVLDAHRVEGLPSGRVATGTSASGSAPTAASRPARTAYAAGLVLPSVGSVSSRHCSG